MKDAVIVSAVADAPSARRRTARCARRGRTRWAAVVIAEALRRAPGLDPAEVEDVILGCAMPEAEQGLNVARIASLRAGVPVTASAVTVNRFCSSGLQSIASAAERIMTGFATTIVAGGAESMSLVPMGGHKVAPNPALVDSYPDVYLTTGLVAENHAREASVSREEQDAFALRSHQRAVAAIDAGRFDDEIVSLAIAGHFKTDEGPRRDTSLEALAKLRPGVSRQGHRHRGELVADERRRVGRRRDVGGRARASSAWRRSAGSSRSRPPASSRSASGSVPCPPSARC